MAALNSCESLVILAAFLSRLGGVQPQIKDEGSETKNAGITNLSRNYFVSKMKQITKTGTEEYRNIVAKILSALV